MKFNNLNAFDSILFLSTFKLQQPISNNPWPLNRRVLFTFFYIFTYAIQTNCIDNEYFYSYGSQMKIQMQRWKANALTVKDNASQ